MIKTKIKNKMKLKVKQNISFLNRIFIDNIFLFHRLTTNFNGFVNLVYPLNKDSQDIDKSDGNNIYNNYYISNFYSEIYNNFLKVINKNKLNNYQNLNFHINTLFNFQRNKLYKITQTTVNKMVNKQLFLYKTKTLEAGYKLENSLGQSNVNIINNIKEIKTIAERKILTHGLKAIENQIKLADPRDIIKNNVLFNRNQLFVFNSKDFKEEIKLEQALNIIKEEGLLEKIEEKIINNIKEIKLINDSSSNNISRLVDKKQTSQKRKEKNYLNVIQKKIITDLNEIKVLNIPKEIEKKERLEKAFKIIKEQGFLNKVQETVFNNLKTIDKIDENRINQTVKREILSYESKENKITEKLDIITNVIREKRFLDKIKNNVINNLKEINRITKTKEITKSLSFLRLNTIYGFNILNKLLVNNNLNEFNEISKLSIINGNNRNNGLSRIYRNSWLFNRIKSSNDKLNIQYVNNVRLLNEDLINIIKNIVINKLNQTSLFSGLQKNQVIEQITKIKISDRLLKDYSEKDIYNNVNSNYINTIINLLLDNLQSNLTKNYGFSSYKLNELKLIINNPKIREETKSLFKMYFKKFSNYIEPNEIKPFFKEISNKVQINLKKNDIINSDKTVPDNEVNKIFNDIYNKYNSYHENQNQLQYNNIKLKLLNKVENIFSQEMYDNFIEIYSQNQNSALRDKIIIKQEIQNVVNKEINNYRLDNHQLQNNLSQIFNNIMSNIIETINKNQYNIKLDKSVTSKIIENLFKNSGIKEIINQKDILTNNVPILKQSIFDFIKNNINNINFENIKINNFDKLKTINSINKVINKEIENLSDNYYKQHFIDNTLINFINRNIDINQINNKNIIHLKNFKSYNNFILKNKKKSLKLTNNLNLIDYGNKGITLIYKDKDAVNKLIDFNRIKDLNVSGINNLQKINKISQNIVVIKRTADLKYNIKNVDLIKLNKYNNENIIKTIFFKSDFIEDTNYKVNQSMIPIKLKFKDNNLILKLSSPVTLQNNDKFKNLIEDNVDIKIRSPFDGFEFIKIVHPTSNSNKRNSDEFLSNNQFKKPVKTFEINNPIKKINNRYVRDVNQNDRIDIINRKIDVKYDNMIKKAVEDKVNDDIQDITEKVYHNIERRLKSEQRRAGIL